MKKDRLLIEKSLIPYSFDIMLGDELFTLSITRNEKHDLLIVALEKDGEVICEGEPIIYGVPLFKDLYQPDKYPSLDIVAMDESGEQNVVTFENFNELVFLTIENYDEEGEAQGINGE